MVNPTADGMQTWLKQYYALVHEVLGTSGEAVVGLCQTLMSHPPGRDFRPKTAAESWETELREASVAYEAWHQGSAAPDNDIEER